MMPLKIKFPTESGGGTISIHEDRSYAKPIIVVQANFFHLYENETSEAIVKKINRWTGEWLKIHGKIEKNNLQRKEQNGKPTTSQQADQADQATS